MAPDFFTQHVTHPTTSPPAPVVSSAPRVTTILVFAEPAAGVSTRTLYPSGIFGAMYPMDGARFVYAFCSCSSRAVLASSPGYVADVSSRDAPSDERAFSSCAANANASKANALVPTVPIAMFGTGARFLLETPTSAPGVKGGVGARVHARIRGARDTARGATRTRHSHADMSVQ